MKYLIRIHLHSGSVLHTSILHSELVEAVEAMDSEEIGWVGFGTASGDYTFSPEELAQIFFTMLAEAKTGWFQMVNIVCHTKAIAALEADTQ